MGPGIKIAGVLAIAAVFAYTWWRSRGTTASGASGPPDEQSLGYLRTNAHFLVWAGFHRRGDIIQMLPEVAVVEAGASVIAPIVDAEFARKREAEKTWPDRTDCDRLDDVFEALNERGILARQYAGYTQSDGADDIAEALLDAEAHGRSFTGYCFYTAQDVEGLLDGGRSLYLAFGTNTAQASEVQQALGAPNNVGAVEAGQVIVSALREFGFEAEWDGSPATRIEIRNVDWQRRLR